MTPQLPVFHLARVVIETTTPLSVGTGRGAGLSDTELLRDANELPAIPGTSIAGVLRHIYREVHDDQKADALFGHGKKDSGEEQASRVLVSWGAIHDAADAPVEGLRLGPDRAALEGDAILIVALPDVPVTRDHVRIDYRGAAAETAKFDRTILPAGFRFSFELALWSDREDDERFTGLLAILPDPRFRLGGATKRGLGAVEPKRVRVATFNFSKAEDRQRFAGLGHGLGDVDGLKQPDASATAVEGPRDGYVKATIELKPVDFWRIGQGRAPGIRTAAGSDPDLVPVREQTVIWERQADGSERGRIGKRRLVVPASGIKGALRHRVAFHDARLSCHFAGDMSATEIGDWTDKGSTAVRELFGTVKDKIDPDREGESADKGQAGRVLLDDAWIEAKSAVMPHNSIDRFTGGVRNGVLFTEELAETATIKIAMSVLLKTASEGNAMSGRTVKALRLALADLTKGRLAIGAGSARGHGYCTGTVAWSDEGAWIDGEQE